MIINLFLIFSTLGNAIDYFSYYKTYILWDNDRDLRVEKKRIVAVEE